MIAEDTRILNEISERWSPRAFRSAPVEDSKIKSLFEAARWAASSRNEQPWRFIIGKKGSEVYDDIVDSLMEGNTEWAKNAPILITVLSKRNFRYNERPNFHYMYDTGQAVSSMIIQATALGLHAHQMGGFYKDKLKGNLQISSELEAVAIIALGYKDEPESLPINLQEKETAKRTRLPLKEIVINFSEIQD